MSYNKIINKIASVVVNAINESYNELNEWVPRGKPSSIKDYDLYNFATKYLCPLCAEYLQWAAWAKVKNVFIKGKGDTDLHRAGFNATLKSIDNPKAPAWKMKVLCKIYNTEDIKNAVPVDFELLMNYGRNQYSHIASVIMGTVYYLPITAVYKYQSILGNACISPSKKFILIDSDYFIDQAEYFYDLKPEDQAEYEKQYNKYVKKA